MATVTPADVLAYTNENDSPEHVGQALAQLGVVTEMVRGYTRGRGFDGSTYGDDLAAVILSATARVFSNPEQMVGITVGELTYRYGLFTGWTLPELAVLNNYRRRAA